MRRRLALWMLAIAGLAAACRSNSSSPDGGSGGSKPALVLRVAYGSEKKTWLEESARAFEATGAKANGRSIRIEGKAMGSGEAAAAIADGSLEAHVFSPASSAYVPLLNDAWLSRAGRTAKVCPAGEPVVLSPIVIAMWKPMAEALGWPQKALGWKDLLAVAANPKGWEAHGHPEWGRFKLGHTHPEFSNSGLLAVLAENYAGAKKQRGLTIDDVKAKATRDFVTSVEGTIVHYGKSTGFFADKMLERGPSYVSAAVIYENLVIESYAPGKNAQPFPLVSIYPVEGTFWSDHPYAVLDAPWVGADERAAAAAFLAFLKARPQQERALALGFRPADPSIAVASPVDAAHGVDAKQPQTLLEVPDSGTLRAVLEAWAENKKSTDVVFVFDKSGSMRGAPLAQAKVGARSFFESLTDRDEVTIVFFDSKVYPPVGPYVLGSSRTEAIARVDGVIAEGGTALYDATKAGWEEALARAKKQPGRIHAVVVMTDGKDENSTLTLQALEAALAKEESSELAPKIFTIAYGEAVQMDVLARIAESGKGTSAKGSTESIVQVYRDMAAFF